MTQIPPARDGRQLVRSSLFVLLAAGLTGELADKYVTRRETAKGLPSIESVILEHSI